MRAGFLKSRPEEAFPSEIPSKTKGEENKNSRLGFAKKMERFDSNKYSYKAVVTVNTYSL